MEPLPSARILLHGIGGVYNYGCEAIIRGTVAILRTQSPDCRIVYLSRRPLQDQIALADCSVSIWDDRAFPRWHPRRMLRALLRRCHLPYDWINADRFRAYQPGDIVLSIGGDIFTVGPPPHSSRSILHRLDPLRRMLAKGCYCVLWGASVGPFDACPDVVPHYQQFLQELSLITVREPLTLRYLTGLGIHNNVAAVADPAFLMPARALEADIPFFHRRDGLVVGVNLSPLSARQVYGIGALDQALDEQARLLRHIMDDMMLRVLLIPHVIAPHKPTDDDYSYLAKIYRRLESTHRGRVALLPPNLGAERTKGAIAKCDLLLATRMHCAIAGASMAVPTLFIAYSPKARGMTEFVYGSDRWCIPLADFCTREGLASVRTLLREAPHLRTHLQACRPKFAKHALLAGDALSTCLSSVRTP